MCYIMPIVMVNVRLDSCLLEHGYKHENLFFITLLEHVYVNIGTIVICSMTVLYLCHNCVTLMIFVLGVENVKQLAEIPQFGNPLLALRDYAVPPIGVQ